MRFGLKYEPHEDCFGFDKKTGSCKALKETVCRVEKECKFYKKAKDFCVKCKKTRGEHDCVQCVAIRGIKM